MKRSVIKRCMSQLIVCAGVSQMGVREAYRKCIVGGGAVAGDSLAVDLDDDEVLLLLGLEGLAIGDGGFGVFERGLDVAGAEQGGQGDQVLGASTCNKAVLDIAHGVLKRLKHRHARIVIHRLVCSTDI